MKYNKLIAEFMGRENPYADKDYTEWMDYHTRWDWLMPVVEKIASKGLKFSIENSHCSIDGDETYFESKGFNQTTIQATYQTVVEFIKWYNKQGK